MTANESPIPLSTLNIDNRFVRKLPADPELSNQPRDVRAACYSFVEPLRAPNPQLICHVDEVANLLGISSSECQSERFLHAFVGNHLIDGMQPYACCYGGHQFGHWAGQLGDGRAINLGEVVTENAEHWTLQLKGAGPTPYRRSADGLAVLRSSVREFLCSEAMHHLGVPTTRALSLISTGDSVLRDMFYDGRSKLEPGAVVCRVAQSFTRFGSFEIFAARNDLATLKELVDYTITHDYPQLKDLLEKDQRAAYLAWFSQVTDKTVDLIVHWMRVGFVHGVMNTDNMSILGLTIDYGPYGWLDNYDPHWTPNTTDAQGRRYRYANQPLVAQWNLLQLANAIYPLIGAKDELESILSRYKSDYEQRWLAMMRNKLGLIDQRDDDQKRIASLEHLLEACEIDMTLFFRNLQWLERNTDDGDATLLGFLTPALYQPQTLSEHQQEAMLAWLRDYRDRLQSDSASPAKRLSLMQRNNPKYILRNYLAQQAIDKAEMGDYSMVKMLLDMVRRPYEEQPERDAFAQKRPEWARHKPGCSMLSCSS